MCSNDRDVRYYKHTSVSDNLPLICDSHIPFTTVFSVPLGFKSLKLGESHGDHLYD